MIAQFPTSPYSPPPGFAIPFSFGDEWLPETGLKRLSLSTRAPWIEAIKSNTETTFPHSKTQLVDCDDTAFPFLIGIQQTSKKHIPWIKTKWFDVANDLPWRDQGIFLYSNDTIIHKASKKSDRHMDSPFWYFEQALSIHQMNPWHLAIKNDQTKKAPWRGRFNSTKWTVKPFTAPFPNAINFFVEGGFPLPFQFHQNDLTGFPVCQFGTDHYQPLFLGTHGFFNKPHDSRLDFHVSPLIQLANPTAAFIFSMAQASGSKLPWGVSKNKDRTRVLPWLKYSRPLNPGWGITNPNDPPIDPNETLIIPIKKVYITMNDFLFTRADDHTPIQAMLFNVAFDCDSYLPTFSATLPESARDTVMPDPNPVLVRAFINGIEFLFYVEKITRTRSFGKAAVAISGRGMACELDAPYAPTKQHLNTTAMTARQLIDAALEYTGYDIDWQLDDWLLPDHTLSLSGTAISVANHVAEAAGAVLAAHWSAKTLRLLPRYPFLPWDENVVPNIIIPTAVTETESIEWTEQPDYNVVYLSGIEKGILAQVKKSGSAGDKPAPLETHQLITHADAARQKGQSVLANTGKKRLITLSMPLIEPAGIVDVCKVVRLTETTGLFVTGIVRSNNISVAFPTTRQTLSLEV